MVEVPLSWAGGRSGVADSRTKQDRDGMNVEGEALRRIEAAVEALAGFEEIVPLIHQLLFSADAGMRRRENSHRVLKLETDSAELTRTQGLKFDVPTIFGGTPGTSLHIINVGGGNLEVSVNGEGWMPVFQDLRLADETILTVEVRVSSSAAGTAVLRLGAFLQDD